MTEAKTYSICIRLRRTTIEDAFVRVPVTGEVIRAPDKEGKLQLDTDKIVKAALLLGNSSATQWTKEDQPLVEPHPVQLPPPHDG